MQKKLMEEGGVLMRQQTSLNHHLEETTGK